ncbi:MAG: hypothetical protein HUJ95_07175 [Bacteroidales bacterium]|nr:hypothetical protein [Bacteroidales bacterium]
MKKAIIWIVAVLVLGLGIFCYFRFGFVFGEGVKAGQLNHVVYKGVIWKTYEGRLIQTGFHSNEKSNGVQSNEFNFSVSNKAIADSLMRCGGKQVELHYKEYFGKLPWRGHSNYIVDQIISVEKALPATEIPIMTGAE